MTVVGIGIDLVTVSEFSAQLAQPGSTMERFFTATERRDSARDGRPERHLAARWAAKEAVIKAWSSARFALDPSLPEIEHRCIEVVSDVRGRPRIRLTDPVASAVESTLGPVSLHVSLTHDGDVAAAVAVIERRPNEAGTAS